MGRLSLKMFCLKKFCDLTKNFLRNFDPYAYHYVLRRHLLDNLDDKPADETERTPDEK